MSANYSIAQLEPALARAQVMRIWQDNLPVECDPGAKFDWTFFADPPAASSVFLLGVEAGDGADPVGTAAAVERGFMVEGYPVRAALLAELAVDARHRTALPAIRLVRQVRQSCLSEFGFAYGFPNSQAAPVFRRCGYSALGRMTRYARVLRHGRYLRQRLRVPLVGSAAGLAADSARRAWHRPAARRAQRDYELIWLRELDARFDRLWERARLHYHVVAERSARFLRWRFLRHPERDYRLVALRGQQGDGSLLAYAVVSFEGDMAAVHDFFGAPEALARLFDLLIPALRRRDAASISVQFLGEPRVVKLLRARGFSPREARRPVIVSPGEGASVPERSLLDPSRWFLTDADHEWW